MKVEHFPGIVESVIRKVERVASIRQVVGESRKIWCGSRMLLD
ncbi:hypothetical protein ABHM95_16180 [Solibacillus isronensis]|nr:hypothetical protein [Solibacillus isronensis]